MASVDHPRFEKAKATVAVAAVSDIRFVAVPELVVKLEHNHTQLTKTYVELEREAIKRSPLYKSNK